MATEKKISKASAHFLGMNVEISTTGFRNYDEPKLSNITTIKLASDYIAPCLEAAIDGQGRHMVENIEITVRGDWELEGLMNSLAFALGHLSKVTGKTVVINDHYRLSQFCEYLNALIKSYHDGNKSLKGISRLAREYKTSHITIPQFFQFDLDNAPCVDLERAYEIYKEVTSNKHQQL